MYVVKVGEYYIKSIVSLYSLEMKIEFSKEIMRSFNKFNAEKMAKLLNGEVILISEEVTNG